MKQDLIELLEEQNNMIKFVKYNLVKIENNQKIINEKISKLLNNNDSNSDSDNDSLDFDTNNMSDNLLQSIGLEVKNDNTNINNKWIPPIFSGLNNSEPIINNIKK